MLRVFFPHMVLSKARDLMSFLSLSNIRGGGRGFGCEGKIRGNSDGMGWTRRIQLENLIYVCCEEIRQVGLRPCPPPDGVSWIEGPAAPTHTASPTPAVDRPGGRVKSTPRRSPAGGGGIGTTRRPTGEWRGSTPTNPAGAFIWGLRGALLGAFLAGPASHPARSWMPGWPSSRPTAFFSRPPESTSAGLSGSGHPTSPSPSVCLVSASSTPTRRPRP